MTVSDWQGRSDGVANVKHDARGTTRRKEGENGGEGDVDSRGVELLEEELRHFLAVATRVKRGFGDEERVLAGVDC